MQCVSCHFENMPGTQSCVRCGTSLSLSTAVIGVAPPRAKPWQKSLRRWLPLRPLFYPLRNSWFAACRTVNTSLARDLRIQLPPPGGIVRMIVPGWAHVHLGQYERGRIFGTAWIASLVVGMVAFGSTIGAIALGFAFAVHAASVLDLVMQFNEAHGRSIAIAAAMTFVLLLAIYVPLGRLGSHIVSSRRLLETGSPFAAGDVVLFRPGAYQTTIAEPGEIVLYRNAPFRTTVDGYFGRTVLAQINGEWVDRVLAGPQSVVRWKDGELTVNGKPSPLRPLNPDRVPSRLEISVPPGACCVFPTTNPYLAQPQAADAFRSQCIVTRSQLSGKVLVRNYPFWRWWWVR
jgi:hypothetical protein